ncbi:MAG: hypothetical protein WC307_03570 [Candidatus Nanoarchaeia archaeon]|jgi:hypothetical protein
MELKILLDNHTDTESLGLFLEKVNGLPLLTELIRRTDGVMALIDDYNNDSISPEQCFDEYCKDCIFLMPAVKELILNARKNDVKIIPIGSNYNLFAGVSLDVNTCELTIHHDDYNQATNSEMLGYIKEYLSNNNCDAAIIVGARHDEIIDELVNYADRVNVFTSNF